MPLVKSKSEKAFKTNIKREIAAGKPQKQAVAIAYDIQRKAKKAEGGLYANIHAKRERIAHGSGEHMRKPGSSGAPTAQAFKAAAKTAKHKEGGVSLAIGRGAAGLVPAEALREGVGAGEPGTLAHRAEYSHPG